MADYGKVYKAERMGELIWVTVNGNGLDPDPSQKVFNHSPDGFGWGYGGSGASQLALAILLDYTRDEEKALRYYQDFKWCFIANAPHEGFQINASEIDEFLKDRLVQGKEPA